MHEITSPDPTPADIRRGYEGNAITIRMCLIFVGVLVGFAGVVHVIVWFVLVGMDRQTVAENENRFGKPVLMEMKSSFPAPNLQPSPNNPTVDRLDMDKMRMDQEARLKAADWKEVDAHDLPNGGANRPIAGQLLSPLRVPAETVTKVGEWITASRTGPTTKPAEADKGKEGGNK